ncbi:MAG: hypothetical protein H6811_06200 [Phycisphaeraceae bacterium]|nr:hypothetical protein [Phycisphaeraceae bacterium]
MNEAAISTTVERRRRPGSLVGIAALVVSSLSLVGAVLIPSLVSALTPPGAAQRAVEDLVDTAEHIASRIKGKTTPRPASRNRGFTDADAVVPAVLVLAVVGIALGLAAASRAGGAWLGGIAVAVGVGAAGYAIGLVVFAVLVTLLLLAGLVAFFLTR